MRKAKCKEVPIALLVANLLMKSSDADPRPDIADLLGVPVSDIMEVQLIKKSLDARHRRQEWRAVYRVEAQNEERLLQRNIASVRKWTHRDAGRYGLDVRGPEKLTTWPEATRPIIIGAGPAGLFAALYLAEAGAKVRLYERGEPVERRIKTVNQFWRRKSSLNENSNVVFGEGGAGTFSDGKIYTRRRDGELGYIFRRLVDFGASPDILQDGWAHLGTDKVRKILPVFRQRLIDLGAEVIFGRTAVELIVEEQRCVGVRLDDGGEVFGGPVIVAAGHSARDTAEFMVRAGADAKPCTIAIGARMEHPQQLIDRERYGHEERGELPPANYRLTHQLPGGGKVHTFCMCPGGMVVPATNHTGRVVVNGMSFSTRRSYWANSAVIVSIPPEIYGSDGPLAGYRWQDEIERKSYAIAGSEYRAPAQRVSDFMMGRPSTSLPKNSYPMGVVPCDLAEVLPREVILGMRSALREWDKKIQGIIGEDAVLIAPETRTTSPLRFVREPGGESSSLPGLFPIGEGAGYGGGIVSCALDGIGAARFIVNAAREANSV